MITSAPSSARRWATARPRRFADPVTRATCPAKDCLFFAEDMTDNDTIACDVARHSWRPRFRCPAFPPAQITPRHDDPGAPPENRHPALLGSAPPRPLPCLDSGLRSLLPGGPETTPYRRRSLPPL